MVSAMWLSPKSLYRHKGFTLLELLVVIGIIVTLVGIGTVSFSAAQMKARNAKRKADLETLYKALEQYYSVCGFVYPDPKVNAEGKKYYGKIICSSPSVTILETELTDPKTGEPYFCSGICDESQYKVCAYLEPDNKQICISNAQ